MDPVLLNSTVQKSWFSQETKSDFSIETYSSEKGSIEKPFESYLTETRDESLSSKEEISKEEIAKKSEKAETKDEDATEATQFLVAAEPTQKLKSQKTEKLAKAEFGKEASTQSKLLVNLKEGSSAKAEELTAAQMKTVQNTKLSKFKMKPSEHLPKGKIEAKAIHLKGHPHLSELVESAKKSSGKEEATNVHFAIKEKRAEKGAQVKASQNAHSQSDFASKGEGEANVTSFIVKMDGMKAEVPASQVKTSFSQFLKQNGADAIVQEAKVVLSNQDSGQIKLILTPEKLGRVKIDLNIKDNHLVGKILVENSNVRDAFKESIDQLSQAFGKEGFEGVELNLSTFGDQSQSGEMAKEWEEQQTRLAMSVTPIERQENVEYYQAHNDLVVNLML